VAERLAQRSLHPVTYDEGLAVARTIRAARYLGKLTLSYIRREADLIECSAKHNRGVQEAIHEATRVSLSTRAKGGVQGISSVGKDRIAGCECIIM